MSELKGVIQPTFPLQLGSQGYTVGVMEACQDHRRSLLRETLHVDSVATLKGNLSSDVMRCTNACLAMLLEVFHVLHPSSVSYVLCPWSAGRTLQCGGSTSGEIARILSSITKGRTDSMLAKAPTLSAKRTWQTDGHCGYAMDRRTLPGQTHA